MFTYPTRAFKENRIILSAEELKDKLVEYQALGKQCEVGLFGFGEWYNGYPQPESVILDKVVLEGSETELRRIGSTCGKPAVLLFDGASYLLIIKTEVLAVGQNCYGAQAVTDTLRKVVVPNYNNLKTGKLSQIIGKWNIDG
jgi:hypothetical protein